MAKKNGSFTSRGFLRGSGTPIVSKPPTDEYRDSPLWDNFGPGSRKESNETVCSDTKQSGEDEAQEGSSEEGN